MTSRSDKSDARRFRWLLGGNGYFMEEEMLCGYNPDEEEKDRTRDRIDAKIREEIIAERKA